MRPSVLVALAFGGCAVDELAGQGLVTPSTADSRLLEPSDAGASAFEPAEEAERADADTNLPSAKAANALEVGAPARDEKPEGSRAAPGRSEPDPAEEARVREWFPEAFVWQPLVQTGDDGLASVDLRVPDSLTTWRVLALAHDRGGRQTGAVHTFDSRLPVSVDPVTPGWLFVGDEVVVPAQVQAMGAPYSGVLSLRGRGALAGSGGGEVALRAGGSALVAGGFVAERSGEGQVSARLVGVDAAERVVRVHPAGRPVVHQRGGALSGPRTLDLDRPGAGEQRVVVNVFPGPLAVVHGEMERVGHSPPGAYGFALVDATRGLSEAAGVAVDEPALRGLRIRSWQRLVRRARAATGMGAVSVLAGIRGSDDPLASALASRMVSAIEGSQRGDGTWTDRERTVLDHVLVQTSFAARTLPERSAGARLRAMGALERHLPAVQDGFTAAWVLASGLVSDAQRPALEQVVLDGLVERDGSFTVGAAEGLDPFGRRPTRAQQLAVTWLALEGRRDLAWRHDLVSELLQGWSAERGFGAGWADLLALEAVTRGLASLDRPVRVALSVDGEEVASGAVDPAQPHVPAVLVLERGGAITVSAEPAVPGLAFVATHTAWVPFTGEESVPGVDVEAELSPLRVGLPGTLTLRVAAPSGVGVSLVHGIPAGTAVEVPAATRSMLAEDPEIGQDRVALRTRPFGEGEVMELTLRVTPGFAGRMATRPLEVASGAQAALLPPRVWTVRR